ncbi:polysaccharide biosynthesis tyrosine autokinase [Phycisphaera mikurensis]|uniref:Uncharacterized protein n=1 Tax=Phycisphaera mikurensis (strain NBRC 102666 / KCTC 22515 / FYK2301M01) TaxID=1142394 RepID=I0IGK7_PHYMF|nr:polysaccharide biosynthesis tyrosine autokinase [Phycisphaera mikurensis]MBB6442923.1 capsular exopolysaccharide synthesis family protein [Phycisphaera mikurensis]BAM04395.1 hypothetical protein PSMK_22360 [Phycisphaera mikurensis NBRC 102666]
MTANPLSTIPPIGPTTGMTAPPMSAKFKPVDPVRLLRQHLLLLVIAGLLGGIVGGGLWYVWRTYAPLYGSKAQLLVTGTPRDATQIVQFGTSSSELSEIENFIKNQLPVLSSDDLLRSAVNNPQVKQTTWYKQFGGDVQRAAEALQEDHFTASADRGSSLINLQVNMSLPADAQQVLGGIIEAYLTKRQIDQANLSALSAQAMTRDLRSAEDEIQQLEMAYQNFIRDNDLATVQNQNSEVAMEYSALTTRRLELELELNAAMGSTAAMMQAEAEDPDRAMSENEEAALRLYPSVASREEQLKQLQEEINVQAGLGRGEQHAIQRSLAQRVEAVERELAATMANELRKYRATQLALAEQAVEGLKATAAEIEGKARVAHERMKDYSRKLTQVAEIQSNLELARANRADAQSDLRDRRIFNAREDITRVQRQTNPTRAELVSPKPLVVIPGVTMLFLGLTGGLLFAREMLDQRVKSPADLKMLPDVALLGVLPDAAEDPSGEKSVERAVELAPAGLMAEAYRQVRTSLLAKMDRRGYKTLLVVGGQPESGASSVAQNLAASLAYNGRRVLVLDVNFRRPRQHELAGIANFHGLVNVLEEDAPWAAAVHQVEDMSLYVLPTGEASEAHPEMLEGQAFRGLLGELETEYDLVVIDAPPALLTSDSQLLAKQVDAIAIVVRASRDPRGMVERMLRRLDGQRADVLGVILNGVRSAAGGYFRKSYQEFYDYRENDKKRPAGADRRSRKPVAAAAAAAGPAAHDGDLRPEPADDDLHGVMTAEEREGLSSPAAALSFPPPETEDEPGIEDSFEIGLDDPPKRD